LANRRSSRPQGRINRPILPYEVRNAAQFFVLLVRAKLYSQPINQIVKPARDEPIDVPNPWVQFRINDVYVPEPVQILMELHGTDLLQGKIIDVSNADSPEEAFAVVEVEGLSQPVVVPMKHVREMR
jgi:hypothetical protein